MKKDKKVMQLFNITSLQYRRKPYFNKWLQHGLPILCLDISPSPVICMTAHIPLVPNSWPKGWDRLPADGFNCLLHLKWQMVSSWIAICLVPLINTCNKTNNTSSFSPHRLPHVRIYLDQWLFSMLDVIVPNLMKRVILAQGIVVFHSAELRD